MQSGKIKTQKENKQELGSTPGWTSKRLICPQWSRQLKPPGQTCHLDVMKHQWSRHRTSFIPPKGKGKHRENLKRGEITVFRPRDQVRESVTRGEGISTPHARSTLWYPLLLSNLMGVVKSYVYGLKLKRECMRKKRRKQCRENKSCARLGPTPMPTYPF